MKKKKLLIFVFCIFIFCGCEAKINLAITSKNDIDGEAIMTTDNSFFQDYYSSNSEIEEYYYNFIQQYDNDVFSYNVDTSKKNNQIVTNIVKNTSKFKAGKIEGIEKLLFEKILVNNNNYQLIFVDNIKDYFNPELEMDIDENSLLDKIELNIQFHNVVTDANSDSYNSVTNTYTWIIDEKNLDRNIEFTITNEKRYDIIIPYLLKKYIGYIILGTFLIGILIFVLVIINKSKRENEI